MHQDIRIASPCTADWNHMVGDDRVRHCAECNLNVYNFAAMTAPEVEELLANRNGRLCVRLHRRRDGTILTRNCPIGFKVKVRRVSRIAGTALAAMFSNVAIAQTVVPPQSSLVQIQQKPTIAIQIHDEIHREIPQAKISLTNEKGKVQEEGFTDHNGIWGKYEIQPGEYTVSVTYPSVETVRSTIAVTNQQALILQLTLQLHGAAFLLEPPDTIHPDPYALRNEDMVMGSVSVVPLPIKAGESPQGLLSLKPGSYPSRKGFFARLWHKFRF